MEQNKLVGGLELFLEQTPEVYKQDPPIYSLYSVDPIDERM